MLPWKQSKLEAQYNAKREAHLNEVADLKQQLELKANEIRNLNSNMDSLKSINEELKVRRQVASFYMRAGKIQGLIGILLFYLYSAPLPSRARELKVARISALMNWTALT